MKKSIKQLGRGEEDLVKNSALMLDIDDQASMDDHVRQVGGAAYQSEYTDNLTVSYIMDVKKAEDNPDEIKHPALILVPLVIVILGIIIIILKFLVFSA